MWASACLPNSPPLVHTYVTNRVQGGTKRQYSRPTAVYTTFPLNTVICGS